MTLDTLGEFGFAGATAEGDYPLRLLFWPKENRAAVRISPEQSFANRPHPGQVLELTAGPVEGMKITLGPNLGDGWWTIKEIEEEVATD